MNPSFHRSLPGTHVGTHVAWLGGIALILAVVGPDWGTEPRVLSGLVSRHSETWTLPAGTLVAIRFGRSLSSHENQPGEVFRVRVERDVTKAGVRVVPRGATVVGSVVEAAGRRLGLDFHLLELPTGERVPLVGVLHADAGSGGSQPTRIPADAVRLLELAEAATVPVPGER